MITMQYLYYFLIHQMHIIMI